MQIARKPGKQQGSSFYFSELAATARGVGGVFIIVMVVITACAIVLMIVIMVVMFVRVIVGMIVVAARAVRVVVVVMPMAVRAAHHKAAGLPAARAHRHGGGVFQHIFQAFCQVAHGYFLCYSVYSALYDSKTLKIQQKNSRTRNSI